MNEEFWRDVLDRALCDLGLDPSAMSAAYDGTEVTQAERIALQSCRAYIDKLLSGGRWVWS
jgi:hypothetical protein